MKGFVFTVDGIMALMIIASFMSAIYFLTLISVNEINSLDSIKKIQSMDEVVESFYSGTTADDSLQGNGFCSHYIKYDVSNGNMTTLKKCVILNE